MACAWATWRQQEQGKRISEGVNTHTLHVGHTPNMEKPRGPSMLQERRQETLRYREQVSGGEGTCGKSRRRWAVGRGAGTSALFETAPLEGPEGGQLGCGVGGEGDEVS